jgi:hypothetical protein
MLQIVKMLIIITFTTFDNHYNLTLIIYPHMINTHQHPLKNGFDGFKVF